MAENSSKVSSIFNKTKWIVLSLFSVALITYLIFNIGSGIYTLVTDCWTCEVFISIYDAFSRTAYQTFSILQDDALTVLSVGLALWIVFETYKIFVKLVSINPELDLDKKYFETIYKKLFLATFVIGALLLNSPRNVFSNTYEIVLDFGSGVGRELLQKKIKSSNFEIPPECQNQKSELDYKDDMALSENTKNNMVCLLKEVHVLRNGYMKLGIQMFEHGIVPLAVVFFTNVVIRVGGFILGTKMKNFGTDKWLNKILKKITKGRGNESLQNRLDDVLDDINRGGRRTRRTQEAGGFIADNSGNFATATTIATFFLWDDVRMGLSGIVLVIGLFMVNMLFAFIIIENMLFMGVALIIFPFLAVCYVFEQTRSYATAALKSMMGFAIGLMFMCVAIVMCSTINDWVLSGMFSSPDGTNITTTKEALVLLQTGKIDEFNDLVGSYWYFIYIIFALLLNFKIISEAKEFASWFGGEISKSGLGDSVFNFSKSVYKWGISAKRELYGNSKRSDKSTLFDKARYLGSGISNRFKKTFNKDKDTE